MSHTLKGLLILIVLVSSSACYLYGYLTEPEESIYTGIRSLNASDFNQHLSFIDQCRKGQFFIRNQFTSQPHEGFMVRPVYFVLSAPFHFLDWSNASVFHIMRIVCGIVLLLFLFVLFRSYGLDQKNQIIAFFLLTLSSGLGFFTRSWIPETVDLNVPEAILFLSLGEAPHFVFSLFFLWAGLGAFFLATIRNSYRMLAIFFLCLMVLWWDHPFDAVIMIFVAVASLLLFSSWRMRFVTIAGIGLISLPAFLYYRTLKSLPAFAGWSSAQNLMSSPSLSAVISGLLPLLILGLAGILVLRSDPGKRQMLKFCVIWTCVQLLIIYLPFPFQRRLLAGIQFPLVLLASYFVGRLPKVLAVLILLICTITNVHLTSGFVSELRSKAMPFYLPAHYKTAFDWLAKQKDSGPVISEFVTGNFIPAYTGHPSFMGHSSLTPEIGKKRAEAAQFYRNPDVGFLNANHIQYVFWGNEEKSKNGTNFSLNWDAAYRTSNISIYIVKK